MIDQSLLPLDSVQLTSRATRFYSRYGRDLEQIREVLNIRLSQLALAYTIANKLPPEAVTIGSRVKSLQSFLLKLSRKDWPQFYYPTEVVGDLIGARVTCWFIDDCEGIRHFIEKSNHLAIGGEAEDYISKPKGSGYRSLHLTADVSYDAVRRDRYNNVIVVDDKIKCEIQIRTKLQDAWADLTHEFHYKAANAGIVNLTYERLMSEISERLASEDRSLRLLRDAYQELAEEKLASDAREGFRES
ncbi:GTP pyrophosphokinase [Glacieibacterium frigidum]|uniref:GTP pyrophosphokinase n=1 Tax=Glacieibacterium frigidum TaxID=2593303 RepID=A0A552UHT3_9SPHN|nr:GTP pyrophosphokinase [Glacieibacterium frigidum]TRW17782.1 GTP pyrophosphokinase [Glacieibacterium frigidum]